MMFPMIFPHFEGLGFLKWVYLQVKKHIFDREDDGDPLDFDKCPGTGTLTMTFEYLKVMEVY